MCVSTAGTGEPNNSELDFVQYFVKWRGTSDSANSWLLEVSVMCWSARGSSYDLCEESQPCDSAIVGTKASDRHCYPGSTPFGDFSFGI